MSLSDDQPHEPAPHDTPPPRAQALADCDTFVANVRAACASPGTQQALRRALARPVDDVPARTHAALLRGGLIPDTARGAKRRAHYAVAALIAARPRAERQGDESADAAESEAPSMPLQEQLPQPSATAKPEPGHSTPAAALGVSLGASLAHAVTRQGPEAIKEDGAEARLHLLVRQDTDGLHRMLPGVVRHLGSAGTPVDYGRLLYDLGRWSYARESIATRWLEDYYRTLRRARERQP
ncbi:type I-E CRISPR-associated protein Cse2/CasB [Streptomyces sp. NPDC059991]|uniref:type I-E CRISPR-associated protein Cse2/CasB n=1 Tax=Streptomyces sp. NPDC059991 TaxID=3347028 RepID=UPI00367A543B